MSINKANPNRDPIRHPNVFALEATLSRCTIGDYPSARTRYARPALLGFLIVSMTGAATAQDGAAALRGYISAQVGGLNKLQVPRNADIPVTKGLDGAS